MFQYTISKFCTIMCGINACTCMVQLRSNPDLDWYTTSIDPGCYLATLWCINCLLICCLACPGLGPRDKCSKVCQVFKVILATINIIGRLNLANMYHAIFWNWKLKPIFHFQIVVVAMKSLLIRIMLDYLILFQWCIYKWEHPYDSSVVTLVLHLLTLRHPLISLWSTSSFQNM